MTRNALLRWRLPLAAGLAAALALAAPLAGGQTAAFLHQPRYPGQVDDSKTLAALLAEQPKADPSGRRGAGGRLVAYRAGQRPAAAGAAGETRFFRTGYGTNEPSLGIAPDGYIYIQAGVRQTVGPVFHTVRTVLRTKTGASFQDVGPQVRAYVARSGLDVGTVLGLSLPGDPGQQSVAGGGHAAFRPPRRNHCIGGGGK